ncbi:MAG: TolC family protein [Candidatus Xenobia bacterium]
MVKTFTIHIGTFFLGTMLALAPVVAQLPAPPPAPVASTSPNWLPPPPAVPGPVAPVPGMKPIPHDQVLHLGLQQALRIAIANSPDLTSSRALVQARRDQLQEVLAGGRLHADLDLTYTRIEPPVTVSFGGQNLTFQVENNYNLGLAIRQTIATFGRLHWQAAAARLSVVASEADYRTQAERLVGEISQAWFQVLLAEDNVGIAQSNVALRQAHVLDSQKLYQNGVVAKYDVIRDQADETQARTTLMTAQNTRDLAKAALLSLMGLPPDQPVVLEAAPTPLPPPTDHQAAVKEAMDRRPELNNLQLAVQSAISSLYWRQSGMRPTLSFDSTYRSFNQVGILPTSNMWTTDITLAVPILDGGLTAAQTDEARQTVTQLQGNLELARRAVLQDVENAWVTLNNTWQRLQLTHQNVTQTEQVVHVAEIRYTGGISTNIERLDAENTLVVARASEASALYEYLQAESQWQRAIGADLNNTLPQGPPTPPIPGLPPGPPPPQRVTPQPVAPPPGPQVTPPEEPSRSDLQTPAPAGPGP